MSVNDTLNYLKISRPTLYVLINKGKIRTVKIGKRTLFDPEDVKKFVEGQKTTIKASMPAKAVRPKKVASKK